MIPELKIEELNGVEHRAILADRLFFQKLIEYIAIQQEEKIVADASALDLTKNFHGLGELLVPDDKPKRRNFVKRLSMNKTSNEVKMAVHKDSVREGEHEELKSSAE